jgi:hypothetical protein
MEGLAKARYGGRYQDALDAALFHIMENYSPEKDNSDDDEGLERYAASVVNTIYRNAYSHEVLSDSVLDIESGNQQFIESQLSDPYEGLGESSADFEKQVSLCINKLLPNFLKDYELFNGNKATRKADYSAIYKEFPDKVILEAVNRMKCDYNDVRYLASLGRCCTLRSFTEDRYLKSMDSFIRYMGTLNGIAVCSYSSTRVKRNVYKVHLVEFVESILTGFYTCEGAIGHRRVCGSDVYCTLSGKLVVGIGELRKALYQDILGSLLARRSHIRVVVYENDTLLLVSSAKSEECGLAYSVFGTDMVLEISRLIVRRVESGC